jgi:antibiotic biosynthesis monooxygenase (ABM) superfamily enzyme
MNEPIYVAVIRKVKPGCEAAFEKALHEFVQQSLKLPGQSGVHVIRPPTGSDSREYGILRRFADACARDAFYQSGVFREWRQQAEPLTEGEPRYQHVTGLETWFTLPGQRAIVPPPPWKMALVTYIAVDVVTTLLLWAIGPIIQPWPFLLRNSVFNVLVVAALTWLAMPLLARLGKRWLYPETDHIGGNP